MPLYHIQDQDAPYYVIAPSWGDALKAWEKTLRTTTKDYGPDDIIEPPQGIQYIAPDEECIVWGRVLLTPEERQKLAKEGVVHIPQEKA